MAESEEDELGLGGRIFLTIFYIIIMFGAAVIAGWLVGNLSAWFTRLLQGEAG